MNKKDLISSTITELILLSQKINKLEKKPIDFGTGEKLYTSEIHTIDAIGRNPGCTSSDLCQQFGITKGAIAQVVKKIADKGYVEKKTNVHNPKEKFLTLTKKGQIAYHGHEQVHEVMDLVFLQKIDHLSKEQITWFKDAIKSISIHLDNYSENN